jgi:uncharacterized repeat protein (TIGR03803 family)
LHNFSGTDGSIPWTGLVQGTNGDFYGTTEDGGANGFGTIFKITRGGKLTTLHSFDGMDGADLEAGLIQATNGNFYGTTYQGGVYPRCEQGRPHCGTVFKITPSGKLTTLHTFFARKGIAHMAICPRRC